jgi:hypothetical protein
VASATNAKSVDLALKKMKKLKTKYTLWLSSIWKVGKVKFLYAPCGRQVCPIRIVTRKDFIINQLNS